MKTGFLFRCGARFVQVAILLAVSAISGHAASRGDVLFVGEAPTGSAIVLSTTGPGSVPAAELADFFGVSLIPGNNNGRATEGSGFLNKLKLPAGGLLTFTWKFVTNEGATSFYDSAFFVVNKDLDILVKDTRSAGVSALKGFTGNGRNFTNGNGFQTQTVGLSGGTNEIGFGVVDTGDTAVSSGILVSATVLDTGSMYSAVASGLPIALSQREVVFDAIATSTRDVNGRLFRLRARSGIGETTVALSVAPDGKGVVSRGSKTYKDYKEEVVAPERRYFELFASGDFGFTDRDNIGVTTGFQSDTQAATVGVEFFVTESLTLGVAGSYVATHTDFGNSIGDEDTEGFSISPYLSWFYRNFYVDGLYSFSSFEHDIDRNTFVGRTAHAGANSQNHTVQLNTGYNFVFGNLVTGPIAGLDYTTGDLGSYRESGAGQANIKVDGQNYDSLISNIGWQASLPIRTAFGAVTPQARASWGHQFLDQGELVAVGLIDSPFYVLGTNGFKRSGSFATAAETRHPQEDWIELGFGVKTDIGKCFSLILDYSARLGQSDNVQQFASIRASVAF